MKSLLIIWAVALAVGLAGFAYIDYGTQPVHAQSADKQQLLPNPDRPYYDIAGNKYDYLGHPIKPAHQSIQAPIIPGFKGK